MLLAVMLVFAMELISAPMAEPVVVAEIIGLPFVRFWRSEKAMLRF